MKLLGKPTDALEAANSIVEKIEHELETSEFFIDDWNDFEELPTTAGNSYNKSPLLSLKIEIRVSSKFYLSTE